jgi:putative membrane protein
MNLIGHKILMSTVHWLVSALALLGTAYMLPGFRVQNFTSALIAAVVIGIANTIVWPILFFLTLPLNIITLGLFTFVINGMVLKLCAMFIPGFEIQSWIAAILGAGLLSVISSLLHRLIA